MKLSTSRDTISISFNGETVSFVANNDRVKNRVNNISNERHVLDALINRARSDDVFWDIGACLGIHAFILAKHMPYGDVAAFEPMPSNRGILVDNKSLNDLTNVTIFREALADQAGERDFAIRESVQAGYGRHSFATGDYDAVNTIPVDVQTGDGILIQDSTIPRPNLVKIDVEGAGPLVIEGMQQILASDECHTVIFETHEPNDTQPSHEDFGYTETEFIELIENCGFTVESLKKDYHFIGRKDVTHTTGLACNDATVTVENGDIADVEADAIVNSAGTTLRMGTGVAGALRDAGGDKLNEAAILQGPVTVGEAVRTPAFDLDADHVLHAASMPHYGDGNSTPDTVQTAIRNAFDLAEQHNCSSIALPLVGCGLGGVPVATGARVIRDTLNDYPFDSVQDVTVVTYSDAAHDLVTKTFD